MPHDVDLLPEDEDAVAAVLAEWRERRDDGDLEGAESAIDSHPRLAHVVRSRLAAAPYLGLGFAQVPPLPAQVPARLGDFLLRREIGRGGMGVVYEAEQIPLGRRVALKVLFPTAALDPHAVERFRREARVAASLHHTNIVSVHAMGNEGETWYYAMDLVEGPSLSMTIQARRQADPVARPPADAVALARSFAGVADGLEVAHQAGILHRDVKPGNLLWGRDGALRLADFGLASMRRESSPDLTSTGAVLGTPAYLAPEMVRSGTKGLDGRSDVYGLGASLFEALALQPLHAGRDAREILASLLLASPPRLRALDATLPRAIEAVVSKATAPRPEDRYATAAQLADDLRRFAGPFVRSWRQVRRHPYRMGVAVLLLGAAATVFASVGARREADQRETAGRGERDHLVFGRSLQEAAEEVRRGRYDEAKAAYDRALSIEPTNWEVLARRALLPTRPLAEALGDVERARTHGLPESVARYLAADMGLRTPPPEGPIPAPDDLPPLAVVPFVLELLCAGRIDLAAGRVEEGLRRLEEVVAAQPPLDELVSYARRARVRANLRRGAVEKGIADLHALRGTGSGMVEDLALLAVAWRQAGRPEEAEKVVAQTLAPDPTRNEAAWSVLASAWISMGALRWADRAAEAGLGQYPKYAHLHSVRSRVATDEGRFADGMSWGQKAAALAPDDHGTWCALGACQRRAGDASAKPTLEKALKIRDCAACFGELAELALLAGDREGALSLYGDVIRRSPNQSAGYLARANLLARMGHVDDAIPDWERAVAIDTRDWRCHQSLLVGLGRAGRSEAAIAAARRAQRVAEPSARLFAAISATYQGAGRGAEALAAAESALGLDAAYARAHGSRGHALDLLGGRAAEAEQSFLRAFELEPKSADWAMMVGVMLFNQGKHEAAIKFHDAAKRLAPEDGWILARRAETLLPLERFEEAAEDAAHADRVGLDDRPDYPPFLLGRAQWFLDKKGDALVSFERANATCGAPAPDYLYWLGVARIAAGKDADATTALAAAVRGGASEGLMRLMAFEYLRHRPEGDGALLPEPARAFLPEVRREMGSSSR